ncbi:GH92 family glycosyl hydrolase [Phocaeicola abscessus]|uniref:GH92 family glycosyl hydrolase n=1 Tax=Phocaeicola abscessus TaxID=555313 RepID=UPI0004BCC884|nr:GH92 family glycosyl hydrolase [Phocaeicola abscessus]
MKKKFLLRYFFVLFIIAQKTILTSFSQNLTKYVNPFIGTDFTGHTYPGATTPFGMVQVGPDNGTDGWKFCSGYHTDSKSIMGFSHTHLSGTGVSEMGDILFMPVIGDVELKVGDKSESYKSSFSNDSEIASPGYYKVFLQDYDITAEMTATLRAAMHRYTYPEHTKAGVVIDLEHGIGDKTTESYLRVIDSQTIVGMRRSSGFIRDHRYYFCARFSKPFSKVVSLEDEILSNEKYILGKNTKFLLQFSTTDKEAVIIKVGLSTAHEKGAIKNLDKEIPGWIFEEVKLEAENTWNSYLGRIEIESFNESQKISFYTSLYHTLLMPNLISDLDGSYSGWDHKLHKSEDGNMYTNFSLWDTYRALHPFLSIMYPENNSHFVKSMLERHKQVGLLPTNEYGMCETWCMIGNHAVPVIVDAFLKGNKSFDAELAYNAVKHAQTHDHNKSDWTNYNRYGYFPFDKSSVESVSRTLESVYDDYCVAMMAKALNKNEDYNSFMKRASNYKNIYHPGSMLVRGRNSKGEWRTPFDPFALTSEAGGGDFTEGNAWQWTWHVQHDVDGLIDLFGTKDKFVQKLDTFFATNVTDLPGQDLVPDVTGLIGGYSQGNEPSHHVAYLYTLADRPDRTAEIVREVFDRFYLAKRDGLCGNDDCGQMSAWYLFSAMGFYPIDPVSGEYVLGAPQAHRISLKLPNGTFTMRANKLSVKNKYVETVRLNGKKTNLKTLKYNDIKNGGLLEFDMTNRAL